MMTSSTRSMVLRFGEVRPTSLALLFALLMTHTALPVSLGQAQVSRTGQDRGLPVAQPRHLEPAQAAGPDAPIPVGPAEGLTLDQAVDRLERENLTLAAMWLEVPQARADILAAEQKPKSLLFIGGGKDGLVRLRPLDFAPKRWARALAARLAAQVIEAQYSDAVRTQTANLYTAYVDVQEAKEQARFARTALRGVEQWTNVVKKLGESGRIGKSDVGRTAAIEGRAAAAATDAECALRKARLGLADLLNLQGALAERLEVRDEPDQRELALPALGVLTRLALSHRPDLRAYRLGLWRAYADWLRAWVDEWPDFYALGPANRPGRRDADGGVGAVPRAAGLLVSLPDSGHYRGKIARARINVTQSRIELARIERQVVLDVRHAHLEFTHSLEARRRLREAALPSAKSVRDDVFRLFQAGEAEIQDCLSAQSEYNTVVQQYLTATIRHRRAALALNTAVGKRVLLLPP